MVCRIVTLTPNPALDMACTAKAVRPTHKIRTFDDRLDPGGGGINVARVVHALGGEALALIMTGGITGRLVEELLSEAGVPWQALPIRGRTRITLNVHDQASGLEWRFVPEGPSVAADEWQAAFDVLRTVEADWIVASGSLPRGIPSAFYAQAAAIAHERGQKFALDSSGLALRAALGREVALLKLSLGELEYLVGRDLRDAQAQEREATALIRGTGAGMVAVSLGRDGAILATADAVVRLPALAVDERSAVGAGDSFLAGLVLGLARHLAPPDALAYAIAAGAGAVTTYGTAHVRRDDVESLFQQICERGAALPGPA